MTIPASELVKITPRVLAGTGTDLVFNGLFLSDSAAAPAAGAIQQFADAESVGKWYGYSSTEYKAAQVYFNGYNNKLTAPSTLMISGAMRTNRGAYVAGGDLGNLATLLTALTAATTLTINDGTLHTYTVNLSAVTSVSAALTAINSEISTSGETYSLALVNSDGRGPRIELTDSATTAENVITEIGGDIATLLKLDNPVVNCAGYLAKTFDQVLDLVTNVSMNWVTLTTINVTPLTYDENAAIVGWVQTQFNEGNQYLYVRWTDEAAVLTDSDTSSITYQLRQLNAEGLTHVYNSPLYAAFVMGCAASIAWDRNNSTITFAYKAQSGLAAVITEKAKARNLIANGVNFMGDYASRNDAFVLFQNGQIDGQFGWIDTYLNSTWLNNALQVQILAGFEMTPRVPYTDAGYTLIRGWVQDVVDRAIANGTIDIGVNLSQTQKNEIQRETGGLDISTELYNSGYYLQIVDATAQIRQHRESPACNFWYTYGGSVHKINLPSTAIV